MEFLFKIAIILFHLQGITTESDSTARNVELPQHLNLNYIDKRNASGDGNTEHGRCYRDSKAGRGNVEELESLVLFGGREMVRPQQLVDISVSNQNTKRVDMESKRGSVDVNIQEISKEGDNNTDNSSSVYRHPVIDLDCNPDLTVSYEHEVHNNSEDALESVHARPDVVSNEEQVIVETEYVSEIEAINNEQMARISDHVIPYAVFNNAQMKVVGEQAVIIENTNECEMSIVGESASAYVDSNDEVSSESDYVSACQAIDVSVMPVVSETVSPDDNETTEENNEYLSADGSDVIENVEIKAVINNEAIEQNVSEVLQLTQNEQTNTNSELSDDNYFGWLHKGPARICGEVFSKCSNAVYSTPEKVKIVLKSSLENCSAGIKYVCAPIKDIFTPIKCIFTPIKYIHRKMIRIDNRTDEENDTTGMSITQGIAFYLRGKVNIVTVGVTYIITNPRESIQSIPGILVDGCYSAVGEIKSFPRYCRNLVVYFRSKIVTNNGTIFTTLCGTLAEYSRHFGRLCSNCVSMFFYGRMHDLIRFRDISLEYFGRGYSFALSQGNVFLGCIGTSFTAVINSGRTVGNYVYQVTANVVKIPVKPVQNLITRALPAINYCRNGVTSILRSSYGYFFPHAVKDNFDSWYMINKQRVRNLLYLKSSFDRIIKNRLRTKSENSREDLEFLKSLLFSKLSILDIYSANNYDDIENNVISNYLLRRQSKTKPKVSYRDFRILLIICCTYIVFFIVCTA